MMPVCPRGCKLHGSMGIMFTDAVKQVLLGTLIMCRATKHC